MQPESSNLKKQTHIRISATILLMLLVAACQFESDSPQHTGNIIQPPPPHPNIYISDPAIYIINHTIDSINPDRLTNYNIPYQILEDSTFTYVFITKSLDSISFSLQKIKNINSVLIFNQIDGPILTTIDRISMYLNTKSKIQVAKKLFHSTKNTLQRTNKENIARPIENIEKLNRKSIETLTLMTKKKSLKCLQNDNISVPYPIIPDYINLEIHFDNDFWNYTDYYYTNGVRLGFTHPIFVHSPLFHVLISNTTNGFDYYGVHIIQNMYTSTKPKVDSILDGDRPWAAYATIGQYLISLDARNQIKHESEINFGVLGPKSGGGFLQNIVHTFLPNNSPPQGWDHQIKTDIIIDYQYGVTKLLFETKKLETYIKAKFQVGTLRDNIKWGFGGKYGLFTPFYQNIQNHTIRSNGNNKLQYNIFGDVETQLIGYDATLQGGVTDRTSIYVIPTRNMQRFVLQTYLGFEIVYGRYMLQFIQYWKSKEFSTGIDHKYVSTRLHIRF